MHNGGITVYINGQTYENVGFEADNSPRFCDGYYKRLMDEMDVKTRYGIYGGANNHGATALMTFLQYEDTNIYFGYRPLDSLDYNESTSETYYTGIRTFDVPLTAEQVRNLYEDNTIYDPEGSRDPDLLDDFEIQDGILKAYDGFDKDVVIPDGVTQIGDSAFSGCNGLANITIPEGVTSIGNSAFNGCSSLKSITLPEGVTGIGDLAFNGCSSLTDLVLPQKISSIGQSAFQGCSALVSVEIPSRVTRILSKVFSDCSLLNNIVIPALVTSIEADSFNNCVNLKTVKGDKGSYAETYAKAYGLEFVNLRQDYPDKEITTETITNEDGTTTEKVTEKETTADGSKREKVTETTIKDGIKTERSNEVIVRPDGSTINTEKTTVTRLDGTIEEEEKIVAEDEMGQLVFMLNRLLKIAEDIYERLFKVERELADGLKLIKQVKEISKKDEAANIVKETIVTDEKQNTQGMGIERYVYSTESLPEDVEWNTVEATQAAVENQTALDARGAKDCIAYDISPTSNGNRVDVTTGSVQVSFSCGGRQWDGKRIRVFDTKNYEWLEAVAADGYVTFEAEHFSTYIIAEVDVPKKGDMDFDGNIRIGDAKKALRAALGIESLNGDAKEAADVDSDNDINLQDVQTILKMALHIPIE